LGKGQASASELAERSFLYRLIQLYTFKDDVVLDPFVGSGTTCIAALKSGRYYIGYDIQQKYVDLANNRIEKYLRESKQQQLSFEFPIANTCVNG